MKRKVICMLLSTAMMLSLLAGCGSSTSTTAVSEPAAEPAEAASETAAAGDNC